MSGIVWDAHACFPLKPDADLSELERYRASGVDLVSVNIGMDMDAPEKIFQVLAGFRRWVLERPESYIIPESAADIRKAGLENRMAVVFDLEGSDPLCGNVSLVSLYYDLGVRQMLLAYNTDNQASGGCMEGHIGLSDYGVRIIREMNRVGMVLDLTHMGYRAAMEACEIAAHPVVYSHSNPAGVLEHVRNIRDDQIKACAGTGGVIGINGVGAFLGGTKTEIVLDHIEYVIQLVGPDHVGLGLDYVVDKQELLDYFRSDPGRFPPHQIEDLLDFVAPEQLPEIASGLLGRGYTDAEVRGVLGENFLRVAEAVWK